MIDISGLNKADVLAALYNASRPQGMGFMHYNPQPMDRAEAEELLQKTKYFDYLKGRVMKIDLRSDDEMEEWLYDRDNGKGAAEAAIAALRLGNADAHREAHREGTLQAAAAVMSNIDKVTALDGSVARVGFADVAEVLSPAVMKAID